MAILVVALVGVCTTMNGCLTAKKSSVQTAKAAVITGAMEHYEGEEFQLTYDVFSPLEKTRKQTVPIQPNGDFSIRIDEGVPIKGTLHFGRVMMEGRGVERNIGVYVEPGDSVHITADLAIEGDIDRIQKTLTFSGSGTANNEYIKQDGERFDSYPQRVQNNHRFIADLGPVDYVRTVDSIRDEKLAFLAAYSDTARMSAALKEFFQDEYINLAIIRKINYPGSNKSFNDGVEQVLPPDYYDFIADVEISDDLSGKALPYLRFTHFFLTNAYRLASERGYPHDYLSFIGTELEGRAKYIYMAYSLGSDFDPVIYSQFGEGSPYPDIAQTVKDKYSNLEGMLPGNPAPPVMLNTLDGEMVSSVEVYKGAFVYIDFWATWCKPCIREFPDLAILKEEYKDENIKFVSISIEQERDQWVSYVNRENLTGYHYWVDLPNKKIYDEGFNITMIPRFVLIDDEGNIVDANAPRPSSGAEIRQLLDNALAEGK